MLTSESYYNIAPTYLCELISRRERSVKLFSDHAIRNLRNFSDKKGHELKVVHYMLKMSHCVIFLL